MAVRIFISAMKTLGVDLGKVIPACNTLSDMQNFLLRQTRRLTIT